MFAIIKYRRIVPVFLILALFLLSVILSHSKDETMAYEQEIVNNNKEYSVSSKEDLKSSGLTEVCNIPTLVNLNDFFNYGKTNGRTSCTHVAEIGGNFRQTPQIFPYNEAARIVCMDQVKRGNCTVLSFGVGLDNSFDSEMASDFGCEVHMFDPTVHLTGNLPKKVYLYDLGLNDKKQTLQIKNQFVKADRYEGILQKLNLTNSQIDYLKIDVEGSEVKFFDDVITNSPHLLGNVQQLAFEIHPILLNENDTNMTMFEAFQPFWKAMHQLDCLGFDLISFVPNLFPVCRFQYEGKPASGCYDVVFLRRQKTS